VLRVAGRLLMVGSVLVVGILLTAGLVAIVVVVLSWLLFPDGIGPDDVALASFVQPS
jgi:hypothetical protein